jgi:inner membrane protein
MDPLTHTLTGLALSRAGLNRYSTHATPVLLLAANAADIDIVALLFGSAPYLHDHRGITHAFVAIPAMALLPVLVVRLFARRPFAWRACYLVSLAGAATHPLLDWTNAYGIRFLLPFSSHWYRLDIASLTDYWILGVLVLAALAPLFTRLVSSEIGARPGTGRGWAVAALCFIMVFAFGRYLLHERAAATLDSRIYGGLDPLRVAALPRPANPFRWRGLVETSAFYSILDVNLLGEFDPGDGRLLYTPEIGPPEAAAMAAARRTEAFRVFLDFAKYPYWSFTPLEGNSMRVEVSDLRFGFAATAVVDSSGRVAESGFSYRRPMPASREPSR